MQDYKIYLNEIISTVEKIERSLGNKEFEDFVKDSDLFDATLMRLHFIGETVKTVPFELKKKYRAVRWRKFARLRNIIGHKYGQVNSNIIWDVIQKLSELKLQVKEILEKTA
jgi:uncharacterized protein with HEPN domain